MLTAIKLAPSDNVATLLADASKGDQVMIVSADNQTLTQLTCLQAIPFGNKIALTELQPDDVIEKGGYPVGRAIMTIPVGQLVHVQNVRSLRLDIPDNIIDTIIKQMGIETA